ncbi:MAG: lipopolysaccharide heptosyltransferase I [Nitrospinae bacterium]|nr:lipopolysaccharide heptosyltransferase I [Nitrospinota bacterium]
MKTTSLKEGQSVLIIKPSSMGDILHALPVAAELKKAVPGVVVDWVAADSFAGLVRMSPYVDGIIPFRRRALGLNGFSFTPVSEIIELARNLRAKKYAAVLDLHGLLRSGLMAKLAKAPVKIGFSSAREGAGWFYNHVIADAPQNHAVERNLASLSAFGINPPAGISYNLALPESDKEWANDNIKTRPYVVINPNARWITKRWPLENYAALATSLEKKHGLMSVITGGPEDIQRGRALAGLIGPSALDLTDSGGFSRLAAILKGAEAVFTNDSGPMHLAAALGVKVVALFGPTNPKLVGPYGKGHIVIRQEVDCSPCRNRNGCSNKMKCLAGISAETVLTEWEKTLETGGTIHGR